jgi:hypothetical protein
VSDQAERSGPEGQAPAAAETRSALAETRSAAETRAALADDVRRVADRFRSLSQARLTGAVPSYRSRAAAGRHAAQALATAGQGVEERTAGKEPAWRTLPELSEFAVGDQVAVTGRELLAALDGVAADEMVWAVGGRRPAADVVAAVAALLAEVRRLL